MQPPYELRRRAEYSGLVTLIFYLLTLKVVSENTCDVGYPCANFSLPMPLCSRVTPDLRDRRPDRRPDVRQKHRLMTPLIMGGV